MYQERGKGGETVGVWKGEKGKPICGEEEAVLCWSYRERKKIQQKKERERLFH